MADPARSGGGRHVHFAAPTTSPYRINPGDSLATPSLSRPVSRPPTGHVTGALAPPWPFNPEETALIRAGYKPCYTPKTAAASSESVQESEPEPGNAPSVPKSALKKPGDWRTRQREERRRTNMAEPRARAARHKGQMNFAPELRLLLLAYGDPSPHPSFPSEPLPETVRVLDEIVTDFVLEMCHTAAQYATYSRRQKIKVDDFRFALRRDPNKLGRVQELLRMERELKEARKAFDQNDDQVGALKEAGKKGLGDVGESVDGVSTAGKKAKGKGKRGAWRDSDGTEGTVSKKRKV